MKIAVLTSSRADYGIYYPLLKLLKEDVFFDLEIIAFGTHLSVAHGYTLSCIEKDGFGVKHQISTVPGGDSPSDIAFSIGDTIEKFSKLWSENKYDLVFALGDRYEMFAAVSATTPFNIKVAHISGGETTLGAIDNVYRHSITLMSAYHFVSTDIYKKRVIEITGSEEHVYNVGALSIDNLRNMKLLSSQEFYQKFNIDLSKPSILITFHPETVSFEKNEIYINEVIKALEKCSEYQLVITMPNTDTMGNMIRARLKDFIAHSDNAIEVESFGALGYLSCMKYCAFMLGNTSSGFVEASFFPKYVINLGDRQKGRLVTPNIINVPIQHEEIEKAIKNVETLKPLNNLNVYGTGNASGQIVNILKQVTK
jgi:GDP/UDP-N,N'-diacetylbacillosamine 2-epimerase (hydrolysing)